MPCFIFTYFPYHYIENEARSKQERTYQDLRHRHQLGKGLVNRVRLFPYFQQQLIDLAVKWAPKRDLRLHYMHARLDYLQIVVSWRFYATLKQVQSYFLQDISYVLNKDRYYPQQWFANHMNQKRISDRATFDYLIGEYMPTKAMLKWVDPKPLPPTDEVHPRNVCCFEELHKKQVLEKAGLITPHGKFLRHADSEIHTLNQAYKAMDQGWIPGRDSAVG
ncbi:MAG: hypothetical protein JKX85_10935 [Phycisphaeraceae bacterium]|nr:hypothetical protein [Phycisphaeraceae bacterium]